MFYVFVIVACNNVTLRNMTSNLRGSEEDELDRKIEKYTKSIMFDEQPMEQTNQEIEIFEPKSITVFAIMPSNDGYDKLPDNFNLEQYLSERKWKNVIGKHLNMAIFVENEIIV
jgi:hypothetical protein